ncbi:putative quinol monooxygenase [Lapillicoccus sp.]|uniref:putative quinol monooxygenase n=1 Tax=Lapillicoccus sp. TaxID=1909287 RepID=UPI0025EDA9C5|nr:putative quinol monooxygenase [Lapillicoccus sp.]
MSDLNVIALIPAKPGSEAVVRAALTELVGHTRQEEGCLKYELFESQATPGTFVTVEEWTSQAALDAHMASPHIAAAFAAAGDAMAGAPAIHPLTAV